MAYGPKTLSVIKTDERAFICRIWAAKRTIGASINSMLNELMHMQHHNDTRAVHTSLLGVRVMFSEHHQNVAKDAAHAETISDDVSRTAIQLQQITEIIERPITVMPASEVSDAELLREFFDEGEDISDAPRPASTRGTPRRDHAQPNA